MRILHTIRSVNPEGGGVIETVKQFTRAMESQGHQVTIASLDRPEDPWVRETSHDVVALGTKEGHYGHSPRFVPWMREHAPDYDAVVVNGLWQFHSFGTWLALHRRQPYVIFPHGMLDPWFRRQYPLKHLKKWLYWPWADYRVMRDATAALFTCEQERWLARQSFWLYSCRDRVAPLGIAAPEVDATAARELFLSRFPACRGQRNVLFLGRIHEKKGCDLLIRSFAEVARSERDLHLILAGPEQQDGSTLRSLAEQFGVKQRITWTGMITGPVKWGAFAAADVFALPSHQENFGLSVVEALASGVPVLISREVNIWREVVQAGAGFASTDDLAGTKSLLRQWLALTPEAQTRMRAVARDCFVNQFEIQQATSHLLRILSEVCSEEGTRSEHRSIPALPRPTVTRPLS